MSIEMKVEIDLLRAEVERMKRCCNGELEADNAALRAEVERLKGPAQCWAEHYEEHVSPWESQNAALRARVEELEGALGMIAQDVTRESECKSIARAALERKP